MSGSESDLGAMFERWMGHARVALPVAVVVGALGAGLAIGVSSAILVLAAAALVTAIAVFWSSVRTLLGETPLSGADAYAIGATRGTEHEQKNAVLRALKDLEFERSVGKISEEDYQELSQGYIAEAKRLMREIDELARPKRAAVEALIAARLAEAGIEAKAAEGEGEGEGGVQRDDEDRDEDGDQDGDDQDEDDEDATDGDDEDDEDEDDEDATDGDDEDDEDDEDATDEDDEDAADSDDEDATDEDDEDATDEDDEDATDGDDDGEAEADEDDAEREAAAEEEARGARRGRRVKRDA